MPVSLPMGCDSVLGVPKIPALRRCCLVGLALGRGGWGMGSGGCLRRILHLLGVSGVK